jgi:hypothetical protein
MKHGKRLLIGMLLLTVFLVNITAPVSAYTYSGYKWNTNYVGYQKDSSIPSSWSSVISAAANTWNNAGSTFSFNPMITNNKLYYAGLESGTGARTYQTENNGHLTRCTTTFNNIYSWSTSSGGTSGCLDVQSVATHEFGHWLWLYDLWDDSLDTEKTMYYYTGFNEIKKRTLDSDDIAGIRSIYY